MRHRRPCTSPYVCGPTHVQFPAWDILLIKQAYRGLPSSSSLDNVRQTLPSRATATLAPPAEAADFAISTEALPWLCEKLATADLPVKQMLPALLAVERLVAYGKELAPHCRGCALMVYRSSSPHRVMTFYPYRSLRIRAHHSRGTHITHGDGRQRNGRAVIARGSHGSDQIVCSTSW